MASKLAAAVVQIRQIAGKTGECVPAGRDGKSEDPFVLCFRLNPRLRKCLLDRSLWVRNQVKALDAGVREYFLDNPFGLQPWTSVAE